jgi:hypothetical protein
VRIASAGATVAEIPIGYGNDEMALHTIQTGFEGFITSFEAAIQRTSGSGYVTVGLQENLTGTLAWRTLWSIDVDTSDLPRQDFKFVPNHGHWPIYVPSGSHIRARVLTTSAANMKVEASFSLAEIKRTS